MPPVRPRCGRTGIARPTQVPRNESHKGTQRHFLDRECRIPWSFPAHSVPISSCFLCVFGVSARCYPALETLLHQVSRIAHDACMGTAGEAGGARVTARRATMESTGVAP